MKRRGIWVIFLIALFLRLFKLSDFPTGFTPDEAAQGYTAYSILKTGRDEWGVNFPLNPRSFGDFKPPLYTYLVVPSIAVFGLNKFAVRLPNALLGSLAVLLVYFLAKELFKNKPEIGLLSALLLTFSPWHMSLSRGAFEANLTAFFLPLAVWLFLIGIRRSWFIFLSSLAFGLNLFTYHSPKFVTPLIFLALVFWKRKELLKKFRKDKAVFFFSGGIILFFMIFLFLGFVKGAGTRASDIGIFSGGWQSVADLRFWAVKAGLPDTISRIFNNKLTFAWGEFIKSYFSYLSPQFLFTQGAGEAAYGMIPGFGLLYLFEVIFIVAALFFLLKEKEVPLRFLLFWVLISPIPAALTRGVGYHANRVAVMMPAIQIISAYGAIRFFEWSKNYFKKFFVVVSLSYCFIVVLSLAFFLEKYYFYAPLVNAPKMSYGWDQAVSILKETKAKQIIISRNLSEPQAYVMFFLKLDPFWVQKETPKWLVYEKEGQRFVDQMGEYFLGNIVFRNFSFTEDWQNEETVFVGMEKDFYGQDANILKMIELGVIKKVKKINYPDGKTAMIIIEK